MLGAEIKQEEHEGGDEEEKDEENEGEEEDDDDENEEEEGEKDDENEEEEDEEEEKEDDEEEEDAVVTPTSQEILAELRRLDPPEEEEVGDSAGGSPAASPSRADRLRALGRLYDWADVADAPFFWTFHSLGGIRRVLEFLARTAAATNGGTGRDDECVYKAASVLSECLFFEEGQPSPNIVACVRDMANMLVRVDGVNTLIEALPEETDEDDDVAGGGADSAADAPTAATLRSEARVYIWTTLRNLTNLQVALDTMQREQKMRVLSAASDCLDWLATAGADRNNSKTLDFILTTLCNLLGSPGALTSGEYKARGILKRTLTVLRQYRTMWKDYEDLAQGTVVFFGCYMNYQYGDEYDAPFDRTLFKSADYDEAISICLACLSFHLSNNDIVGWAFWMLKKSSLAVSTARMEKLGVVESVGIILKSRTAPPAASKKGRELMRILYRK